MGPVAVTSPSPMQPLQPQAKSSIKCLKASSKLVLATNLRAQEAKGRTHTPVCPGTGLMCHPWRYLHMQMWHLPTWFSGGQDKGNGWIQRISKVSLNLSNSCAGGQFFYLYSLPGEPHKAGTSLGPAPGVTTCTHCFLTAGEPHRPQAELPLPGCSLAHFLLQDASSSQLPFPAAIW